MLFVLSLFFQDFFFMNYFGNINCNKAWKILNKFHLNKIKRSVLQNTT